MWEPGYVTERMGPRRYRVRLLNEDQLWHRHQSQLRYRHVEDYDTQCAEITGAARAFPITGDSPPVFLHDEDSAEDTKTTASDSIPATSESLRGTRFPLRDCLPSIRYSYVGLF